LGREKREIKQEEWDMVWRMLREGVGVRAAARISRIALSQLQEKNKERLKEIPMEIEEDTQPQDVKKSLVLEVDEMHSFVQNKKNVVWIWLAFERDTKRIVAVHLGTRELKYSQAFINKIPKEYLEHGDIHTDGLAAYEKPLFKEKCTHHQSIGKGSGMTNHIERFNGTLRHKLARLTRRTYRFSKSTWHHERMIMDVVHNYNREDAPRILREAPLRQARQERRLFQNCSV
jgi:IS1 family transposase